MNNPDNYFPELNIPFLKNFVRYRIIKKKFDSLPLKKVVLYRYFSEHFPSVARKYVISFELGIDRDKLDEDQREKVENLDVLGRQTIFDKDYLHHYWGLDDPFRTVYRNGPTREDFLIEWFLLPKMPNEEMPLGVMIDQPYVRLYDSSGKKGKGQDEKKKKKLIEHSQEKLSKVEEVNRLAEPANRKDIPSDRTTVDSKPVGSPDTLKAMPSPAPEKQADDSIPVISFYKKDDYWQIGKKGNEAHLKPLKGYELIQFLIRKENESFDPITLYNLGVVPVDRENSGRGLSNLERRCMSNQKTYDKKTFAQVKKQIEKYSEELGKAQSLKERENINDKIKKGTEYLKQSKNFLSERGKCEHNIRELINRAIKKLHKEAEKKSALSPLKKYLIIEGPGQTIIIGLGSYYKPNPSDPVKWKLDSN